LAESALNGPELPPASHRVPPAPPAVSINRTEPDVTMDLHEDDDGLPGPHQLTEERVARLTEVAAELNSPRRSTKSSTTSSLTDPSEMEIDDGPTTVVQSRKSSPSSSITDISDMVVDDKPSGVDKPRTVVQSDGESEDSDSSGDDSDSDNGPDDPMSSDADNDGDDVPTAPTIADQSKGGEQPSADSTLAVASQLADVGLRRSSRNKAAPPVVTPLPLPTPLPVRKPVVRKDKVVLLVSRRNRPSCKN
jgi:hypothetical protein